MNHAISPFRLWWFGLLALPVAGAGTLAWTQHRQTAVLQATVAALTADNARRENELAALDRRRTELQRELADAQATRAAADAALTPEQRRRQAVLAALATIREKSPATGSASTPPRLSEPSGSHGNVYFPELFSDPRYAQVYTAWSRQRIAERFAPLLARVNLPPAETERLKELLVQKNTASEEVDGIMENDAMRTKTPMDRMAAMQVKGRVNRTFEDEIKQTFGDTVFAQWRAFEGGTGARQELLDQLALRLSYSPAPLEDAQLDQLIAVWSRARNSAFGGGGPSSPVSDAFVTEAKSILKPEQMVGLLQLQTELAASRGGSTVTIRSGTPPPTPPPAPGGR